MRIHPPDGVVGAGGMITDGINQEEADKNSTGIANTTRNNKRLILGDNNN
jgi:hypothetical protein